MSKKQAKDSMKDSKQQAQPKATNLSPIPELDMFDYAVNRINVSAFNKAKKKLSDYIGIKFGRNNQIFETGHDYRKELNQEEQSRIIIAMAHLMQRMRFDQSKCSSEW